MTIKSKSLAAVVVLVAVAVSVSFARMRGAGDGTRTFEVTGVVTAAPAGGRVTIAHEEVSGYMPAMTMTFAVGPDIPALAAGDRVRFTLRVADEGSRAEAFVVSGRDAAVAAATPPAPVAARLRLKKGDPVPAFSLSAHDGRPFTAADLRGRLTAVTFVFTRCPVPEFCPLMVKRFQQVQREVGRDRLLRSRNNVQLLSVTLDPAFDTPPVLQAYARAMGAVPGRWHFLTGDPAAVARLTSAFSIYTERNAVTLDHTLATAVVDAEGRIAEIWRGNGWTAADVLGALRREAAITQAPPGPPLSNRGARRGE
jgi:protein SCO1